MTFNENTGYITLQIPNTRFKISYQPVQFDFEKFLDLIHVNENEVDMYNLAKKFQYDLLDTKMQYETEKQKQEQCQKIQNYLFEQNKIPKLKKINELIQPNTSFLRHKIGIIGAKDYPKYKTAEHVGINSKELNEEELQAFVNYYYKNYTKLPFYMCYIFYMFYERLHPSEDGNGRIGRLIFVENLWFHNHFPLEKLLNDMSCPYVNQIYKLFSFPKKLEYNNFNENNDSSNQQEQQEQFRQIWLKEPEDNEKYFSIELDKESVSKIILILLFSILFKQNCNNKYNRKYLIDYFKDPFQVNNKLDGINIENFNEIREMINQLNWK